MPNEIFIKRSQYSDVITKRVISLKDGFRQNVALIGDELIGKTTLLFELLNKFRDNRILVSYLECRVETLECFSKRFIATLLYNFLDNADFPLKEDLDFLIRKSSKYMPKAAEKIHSILSNLKKRKRNNIFTELLSLCELIHEETGKSCVVVFDEFHNLENLGIKNLYSEWSRLLLSQKNTMYLVTSSLKYRAKVILEKNLSLLFGNFEILHVEPFEPALTADYLEQKLCGSGLNKGHKDFIAHFTGGFPFYLKVIADAVINAKAENLIEIMEGLLFEQSGILNQRFSNYIRRFTDLSNSQEYISLLYLVACGQNKIKEISNILRKPKKELDAKITRLLEMDTITRSGDFLKISDRVFGFWIKFVYRQKLGSLSFDAKPQKDIFRDNLKGMLEEFLAEAQKPLAEKTAQLLRLFENDTMLMEKKKIRLSHFREIKPLELGSRNLKTGLIGRSAESLWIIAFKQGNVSEEDISEFSKECKRYRNKPQKKIIIALRDIDTNARLKAMEEKIWAWDINNLNQILDLFSRPRVIV